MIWAQPLREPAGSAGCQCEDPDAVAFLHRLKFAYSPDDGLELDADIAEHLQMVCDGEQFSDWSGDGGRLLGGTVPAPLRGQNIGLCSPSSRPPGP